MEKVTRRTAVAMLGLAGASGAAIAAEDIAKPLMSIGDKESGYHFGASHERIVKALRRLADDIEGGGSHAQSLLLTSKLSNEDFLTHTLSIEFAMDTRDRHGASTS
jgi:hypothetical protein